MNEIRLPSSIGLAGPADVDGDHRLQADRVLAALLEERAHAAGGSRQQDVVELDAERPLDPRQIVHRSGQQAELAQRRDRRVELRGRAGPGAPHREARPRPAEPARRARAPAAASGPRGRESPPGRAGCAPGRRARARAASSRWGATPAPTRPARAAERPGRDRAAGCRARRRRSRRPCSGGPCRPRRSARRRAGRRSRPATAGAARGSGFDMHSSTTSPSRSDSRGHHVPGDVEVEVVHPNRGVDPERHRLQRLPVPRRPRQPACDVLAKLLEAGPDPVGGRLEDRRPAHVHVGGRRLDRQERGVKRRQAR